MFLKKDIRQLNKQLELIKISDTNARLTTETFDSDIVELCNSVNAVLDERREAVIKAETSNTELKRAITNISHDLRTPLTSALGYLQMARKENDNEHLQIIEERLKSLTVLMNSLFEYTQIIEGKTEQIKEKVNVCNILRDVTARFYGDFINKGFEVKIEIPEEPIYVYCDPNALERAAQNLVKNALEHGYNQFELIADDKIIEFRNRVLNIDELDVNKMFERFYTADLSRNSGNTGLGLAITKELVESMGGKIIAEKENDMLNIRIIIRCEY